MRWLPLLVALAVAAPLAAHAGPQEAVEPPATQARTWFLTTQEVDVASHGLTEELAMADAVTGDEGQVTFSSVASPVPLPLPESKDSETWYRPQPLPLDTQVVGDAVVVLYLDASLQANARLLLELRAVSADGVPTTLATASKAVTVGTPESAELRVTLPQPDPAPAGSVLALTIGLDDAGVATVLSYNTDTAPTRIEFNTRPLDSDEDGVPDTLERAAGTDPNDRRDPGDGAYDSDGDGLPDWRELELGTDPFDADSDADGWVDGAEVQAGTDPLNGADRPADRDDDGLYDAFEARAGTSPERADSTGNGLGDCLEDPDEDNLTNCQEQMWGTDPLHPDTDGDGILDGDEVRGGTDPTVHGAPPRGPQPQVMEVATATVFLGAAAALAYVGLARRHRL